MTYETLLRGTPAVRATSMLVNAATAISPQKSGRIVDSFQIQRVIALRLPHGGMQDIAEKLVGNDQGEGA
ncbi:hypothetical protein [Streptomyces hokutonensis]|uniref:hypothetical protein n=1 Tax=Streptomyces hokutonensis TaxID=1306990 RepID=UPI0036A156FF